MAFQSTVRPFLANGVIGEIAFDYPSVIVPKNLASGAAKEQFNLFGAAFTQSTTNQDQVEVGGTGAFAGILCNPKVHALYGTGSDPLAPSLLLADNQWGEFMQQGAIFVELTLDAGVAEAQIGVGNISFNQNNGTLTYYTGALPADNTLIEGATVIRYMGDETGLYAIELK